MTVTENERKAHDAADAGSAEAELRQAEREARQAENRAKREVHRAEQRALREAQRRKNQRARAVARGNLVPGQGEFNILIVAQNGRLAREAVLFAASLRRNSPKWSGRLIVAEPTGDGAWQGVNTRLSDRERGVLQDLDAEIVPLHAQAFGRDYPNGNKIEALELLPPAEPFLFFDTDTVVLGELSDLGIDFQRPCASMRRTGTWPIPPLYGPGYSAIWKSLYDRFSLDFSTTLDLAQPDEHWERYLYFNAGWFTGDDPREFGRRFREWAIAIRDEPGDELACQSLYPWLDQIVLPLVIHSFAGGRPGPEMAGLDGHLTCHYRNLSLLYAREADDIVTLVEELILDPLIAPVFAEDEAVQRLVLDGMGREKLRPMFEQNAAQPEQNIRHKLKRAELWFH
ncbi:hypothetical protein RGQ15_09345 [Paracoccus sp. MBLB3053]|uniref:Glycosyl transferase n=1 Tax=Paracoccus aurantius TaxID=3073814 RepID=A0ABU2HRU0_9RHOB|nr:hypothetical protein [Paracoccus sp. MBLB3053]MDS9467770.1 hypothetical protein [Paracoccus sp. MBLB3053]